MPRFDLPDYLTPIEDVLPDRGDALVDQRPLPRLHEPTGRTVDQPRDEPLVPVAHRRIRLLCNYWHAGWDHARPDTMLRSGVVQRLVQAVESLPPRWGFAIFDAWRPLSLQTELYESAYSDPDLPPGFLAAPSTDPATPPPHLTGGAVDLTLTLDGVALALGSGFDDTSQAAEAAHLESRPGPARDGRRLLYWTMADAGFIVFDGEWWHFEHGTTRWAGVTGGVSVYGPASPSPPPLAGPQ